VPLDESFGLTQGIASRLRGEGFQAGYDAGVARYRGGDKAAKEANLITSIVGEVPGSVPAVVAAGATGIGARALGLTGPNLVFRSAMSAGSGGAIGTVQGFNNAEGTPGEGIDRSRPRRDGPHLWCSLPHDRRRRRQTGQRGHTRYARRRHGSERQFRGSRRYAGRRLRTLPDFAVLREAPAIAPRTAFFGGKKSP
jgi:hypothetical protein